MRVLHIDTGREMRGGQWQVLFLSEGLETLGHRTTILAPAGSPLYSEARARNLDVRPIGVLSLARLSKSADIAHVHDARAHTQAAVLSARPFVVSRRVAFPVRRSALSRWKYSRASHYIAVSEYVRKELITSGIEAARVSVVYDGIPLTSSTAGGTVILAPETSDAMKGSDLVSRASRLAGVEVQFSRNLTEDLRQAKIFVYISRCEGLGSGVLLAMAAGVPVIASRVGGLPEIVEDKVTGLLVDNTPENIAGAIRRLQSDSALAFRLAYCAREQVHARFSAATMVERTIQVYAKVLPC